MKTPHASKFKGDQRLSCKFQLGFFPPLNPNAGGIGAIVDEPEMTAPISGKHR